MQLWTSKTYKKEDKIYRGAYSFIRNDNIYGEEIFDVYRDKKDHTFHYVSEAIIKVNTGEILNLYVEYITNQEYFPLYVGIEKVMGKETSKETYTYNVKKNSLEYEFTSSKHKPYSSEIAIAPKYHITTPTAASSMLFMRSKKLDQTGKNFYNILVSNNQWEFKELPYFKTLTVERASLTNEKMAIDGQLVQATQFKLFDEDADFKSKKEPQHVKSYMSSHGTIAYQIKTDDGSKIQIKYLNDLSDKE